MTLAMVLVASLAFLSSGCSLLFAARMAKLSRESSEKHLRTAAMMNRRVLAEAQTMALGSQQMAREVAEQAMSAATAMVDRAISTIFPVASERPPNDSAPDETPRQEREPWEGLTFGAEEREQQEAELEEALSRTWPRATVPTGAGMPSPMEAPAGWSDRPQPPPMVDGDDPVAAAERYHRERYFDPSP